MPPPMVLSAVSVLAIAGLGFGVAAGIVALVGVAAATLVVVALANAITVLGRLLDTYDD
jgi:hypothetical protein